MPSSLFGDLGGGSAGLVEDQRAFQLALELSMLSLGENLPATNPLASPLGFAPPPDDRAKKSQNMTECVPVPSSEHVAEIVGRQGRKFCFHWCIIVVQCVLVGGPWSEGSVVRGDVWRCGSAVLLRLGSVGQPRPAPPLYKGSARAACCFRLCSITAILSPRRSPNCWNLRLHRKNCSLRYVLYIYPRINVLFCIACRS